MLTEQRPLESLLSSYRSGWSLEQPFYTDDALFAMDIERLFRRYWLFVGHAAQIPQPGDYFLFMLGSDSIILIRDEDGQVRALFNVCRHRGSHLCLESEGRVKKLVCPYHQWVYEKNGALASARLMPEDFDKSGYGLYTLPVQVVEGLLFISFNESPPDFAAAAQDYRSHLRPYCLEEAKICHTQHYELATNWKLITENFRECYHCGGGHPEYCRAVIGANLTDSSELQAAVWKDRKAHWEKLGLDTRSVNLGMETWHHVTRYPFRPGVVSESLDGQPVAPLMGTLTDPDAGVMAFVQYPNFWLEASSDYVWTMRMTPVSATRTDVDLWWQVRADAVEGVDYEVEKVAAFWRATAEQDWALCVHNQAGVNSSRYRPGPYSPAEKWVEIFLNWYIQELGKAR